MTRAGVLTSRDRRRLRTRRELALAAVRLFETNGFADTTVEEIALAADYSASSFFRLFPRKEDAVFFDMPERMGELRDSLGPDHGWPAIRSALIEHARTWEADDPEFAAARVRLLHREPALTSRYLDYCQQYESWLTELVASRNPSDGTDPVLAQLVAACVIACVRSAFYAQANAAGNPDSESVTKNLERAFQALESGPLPALAWPDPSN
ncbi:MAG TPA: TetR family transcriptional regulator [Pseudonocardia sp.]